MARSLLEALAHATRDMLRGKTVAGESVFQHVLLLLLNLVTSLVLLATRSWAVGLSAAAGLWDPGARKQMQFSLGIRPGGSRWFGTVAWEHGTGRQFSRMI